MVKVYKGDERIEPPQSGWATLVYSSGYMVQCSGAKVITYEGKEFVDFYLYPYPHIIKRFGLDVKKDLDRNLHCHRIYPKNMVLSLNMYDPSRRVFFSMLDFDGKPTEATKWFLGMAQNEEIERLRSTIRSLKAHNEKLREENFILKTRAGKYYQKISEEMIKPMIPAMRALMVGEQAQGGQQ